MPASHPRLSTYLVNYSVYPVMYTWLSLSLFILYNMYLDQVNANMTINNMSGKHILFNISIIERHFEFKPLMGHRRY